MNSFRTPEIIPSFARGDVVLPEPKNGELLIYSEIIPKGEVQLPCDALDPLKRRILIAVNTYGINSPDAMKQIAAFCEIPLQVVIELIEGARKTPPNWLGQSLSEGIVPCFSKAELVSRICIEAEHGNNTKDRLNALGKLMEFRGLTAPEGGSKSFQRIAMKFKTS